MGNQIGSAANGILDIVALILWALAQRCHIYVFKSHFPRYVINCYAELRCVWLSYSTDYNIVHSENFMYWLRITDSVSVEP